MRVTLVVALLGCLWIAGCTTHVTTIPESSEAMASWQMARDYHAQGRYELAKQYYQVALANTRTLEAQTTLKREIEAVDRVLQTMR